MPALTSALEFSQKHINNHAEAPGERSCVVAHAVHMISQCAMCSTGPYSSDRPAFLLAAPCVLDNVTPVSLTYVEINFCNRPLRCWQQLACFSRQ